MWFIWLLSTVGGLGGGSAYGENINRFTKSTFAAYWDTHKHKDCGFLFILTLHGNHNRWKVRMEVPLIWQQLAAVWGTEAAGPYYNLDLCHIYTVCTAIQLQAWTGP
jgi:hypothetical protein